jgi:uncharacterized protein (DUF433 family)
MPSSNQDKCFQYYLITFKLKSKPQSMDYSERIVSSPAIMLGKPTIKGTRITVEFILRKLSENMDVDQIIKSYPQLSKDDIMAALTYASDLIANEEVIFS